MRFAFRITYRFNDLADAEPQTRTSSLYGSPEIAMENARYYMAAAFTHYPSTEILALEIVSTVTTESLTAMVADARKPNHTGK